MYLIAIAWIYVALMMAVAEATHASGTVLGAIVTFFLYGLGPVALVVYLMQAPARRKAIKARELAAQHPPNSDFPDTRGQPPAATQESSITPVRKEP